MAKNRFNIKPKLGGTGIKPKKLPVQNISVEQIEEIAIQKKTGSKKDIVTTVKAPAPKKVKKEINNSPVAKASKTKKNTPPLSSKQKKRPQGRPPRTEAVKRLSSDLPAYLYDKVKEEVQMNGYTLNGFLAKVIREHFDRKENK